MPALSAIAPTGDWVNVSGTAAVGTTPIFEVIASADDNDYAHTSTNSTGTYSGYSPTLTLPSDFGMMTALSVRLRYHAAAALTNTWNSLQVHVTDSAGTALTDTVTLASSITTTTPTNSDTVGFLLTGTALFVSTKADWEAARLVVTWNVTKVKGGDTIEKRVTAAELTGTYDVAAAVVSATMAASLGSLTASAAATPIHPATLAASLGGLTGSISNVLVSHAATMDSLLGSLISAISATTTRAATMAAPLGGLIATTIATTRRLATMSAPLGSLTGSASAVTTRPVTLAASLGGLTGSMAATVTPGGPPVVPAVMDAPLGALTAAVSVTVGTAGTYYAVAAGGLWDNASTWATTSGGTGGAGVPTAAINVVLDANSGNVTINAASVARSLDCLGYTGTLTHNAFTLTLGDATPGTDNRALRLVAGMTYTLANAASSGIAFASTSATQQTVDYGGKTAGNQTFSGVGGSWLLASAMTSTGGNLTVTAGTFDTGDFSVAVMVFASTGTTARTVDFGASAITIGRINNQAWSVSGSNLTFAANTATATGTGTAQTWVMGAFNYNGLSLVNGVGTPSTTLLSFSDGGWTVANLTITGLANKFHEVLFGGDFTVTDTLTLTGNSLTNRVLVRSNVLGTQRTITLTGATVHNTNVDFTDIAFAGSPTVGTTSSVGNALGNSGITFTAKEDKWGVAAGNWDSTAVWATSSGGTPGAAVPLCHDDVYFDAASGTGTVTRNMARLCADLDCTGYTGALGASSEGTFYGSITVSSGMTYTPARDNVRGRSTHFITSSGKTLGAGNSATGFRIQAVGGTYTLADAFVSNTGFHTDSGTFDTDGFALTASFFQFGSGTTAALLRDSLITVNAGTSQGNLWNSAILAANFDGDEATFFVNGTGAVASRNWTAPAGSHFGTLIHTNADQSGALVVSSAQVFGTLSIGPGRSLTLPTTSGITVADLFDVAGQDFNYLRLPNVSANYVSTPDSVPLSITGDIDIMVRVAMDDWTPGTIPILLGKEGQPQSSNRSYAFALNTNGTLFLRQSVTGSESFLVNTSLVANTFVNGDTHWVRATLDADNGSGNRVAKFYYAADEAGIPTSWTQLGATVTNGGVSSAFDGTAALEIGSGLVGGYVQGGGQRIYRAVVKDGYDGAGTVQFDADFTTKPVGANTFTEDSANAATVTITGALAQAGDGRVALTGDVAKTSGLVCSDYLVLTNSDATGGATFVAGRDSVDNGGNTGWSFVDCVHATLAAPLGGLTGAMAATVTPPDGALMSAPLGSLAATISATVTHAVTLSAPLGSLTGTMAATVTHAATMSAPLGSLTGTMAVEISRIATLDASLGTLTATAAAMVKRAVTMAAPLGGLTATAVALPEGTAFAAAPLGSLNALISSTVYHGVTLNVSLGSLTGTITAIRFVNSSFSSSLGEVNADVSASVKVLSTLLGALGSVSGAITSKVKLLVSLNSSLGVIFGSMVSKGIVSAIFNAPLGTATATTTPTVKVPAALSGPLSGVSGSITSTVKVPAALSGPLNGISGEITSTVKLPAALSGPLNGIAGNLTAKATVSSIFFAPLGALFAQMGASVPSESNVYLGDTLVTAIYLGDTEVTIS